MTTETIPAVSGEVVISDESTADAKKAILKENETIIKRNWKAATEKANTVYRALTIIHSYDLWKLHLDAKGKRKYTAFEQYLFGEFGWELSRVRALQVIKATRAQMIEAGELPASTAQSRTRTAPEVTSERAAKVTSAQLSKALEAFENRINSIDEGDPDKAEMVRIFNTTQDALNEVIADLDEVAARAAVTSDTEPESDEDEDEDEDDETEDESN